MDKLRALTIFCRAAESKSFASAAHELDVAPSVLSKTISSLEAEVRFKLFNRTTRRISLTEEGGRYYERCKRIIAELNEAELQARDGTERPVGRVIAALHPSINRVVMSRINEFLNAYPDILLETTMTSTATTMLDDRLDVLFMLGDLADSNFGQRKLADAKLVLVASPSYLARHSAPRSPRELPGHTFIVSGRPDGPSFTRWTMTKGARKETVNVPVRAINRQGIFMHEAALSGAGICRLYEFSISEHIEAGTLSVVLPDWSLDSQPINAVFPNRKSIPIRVRALVDFVRTVIRDRMRQRPVTTAN